MLIYGSQIRTVIIAILVCLAFSSANAQDDPSQRPLPLPERGVADLPQHMELLKRLRSLVESQQKNSTKSPEESESLPRIPDLPSPADSNSSSEKQNQTAPQPSPFQPQQLQRLQDALKSLASQLPPGFVPPDLSSVPPDQLRKAMENPAVQQQMKQMLEQFARDGVLPNTGTDGSQIPIPPQSDGRKNDGTRESLRKTESRDGEPNDSSGLSSQQEPSRPSEGQQPDSSQANGSLNVDSPEPATKYPLAVDDSATGTSDPDASPSAKSDKDAPAGSMRSLRSFLKKLAEDAGMKSPDPSPEASGRDADTNRDSSPNGSARNEPNSREASDEQIRPAVPQSSSGNSVPSTRRPLRKRDSTKPKTSLPGDSSNNPTTDSNLSPSGQFPETSQQPSNRPNAASVERIEEDMQPGDVSEINSPVASSSRSNPARGLKFDPEAARKQLDELQKTIERMKQVAEESEQGQSPAERPSSEISQPDLADTGANAGGSDSNSVTPSTARNNRMANRPDSDNRSGEQLPEALPEVEQFLREQLKNFKLPPDVVPGNKSPNGSTTRPSSSEMNSRDNPREVNPNQHGDEKHVPADSILRNLPMDRPLRPEDIQRLNDSLRPRNTERPDAGPSTTGTAPAEKPPMDIAKELQQGGFGNTLKKLVERAKEEAKKPRPPVPSPAEEKTAGATAGPAANIADAMQEAAKNADPELSDSMAKMLDGLKDDLVRIAKDAKFNDPPERSRSDRSMNRKSPAESNSMIDSLRKSASEILAGPSRSSNSRNSSAPGVATAASETFSGEFDFTPVFILAGILAALAIAFFGLRHFKFGWNDAAELQFVGPPLKPDDIKSRADVVRAFHEFALQSAQSVQSWWTHRTVQQAILEKAPESRDAVETLADTYEQARYLPAELELSAQQLESARAAFQQCNRKSSHG